MTRVLLIDHQLMTTEEVEEKALDNFDLVVEQKKSGNYQVWKNGLKIINHLNEAVCEYRCQVAIYSTKSEQQLVNDLSLLHKAAKKRNIHFPLIVALAISDPLRAEKKPVVKFNPLLGMPVVIPPEPGNNNSNLRKGLADFVGYKGKQVIVFETDSHAAKAALSEKSRSYPGAKDSCVGSLQNLLLFLQEQVLPPSPIVARGFFQKEKKKNYPADYWAFKNTIAELQGEINSYWPYPYKELKKQKVKFLEAVLRHYERNSDEDKNMAQSIEWAQACFPWDYEVANSGNLSQRTFAVLQDAQRRSLGLS